MKRLGTVLAAFLIIVALMIIEIYIIKSASNYEPAAEVVFAKTRIPEKCKITEDMLELKKVGIGLLHVKSLRNIRDVAGKTAAMEIEAGEIILTGKLGYEGMESIKVKDRNKRLFTVEFKGDQANGWWLVTDQHVDIIFVPDKNYKLSDEGKSAENPVDEASLQIYNGNMVQKLRNIRIAALIDENGKLLKDRERATLPRYVSFEVDDAQVDFLAYAKSHGRLEICVIPD